LDVFREEDVLETCKPKIALLEKLLAERIGTLPNVGEIRQFGFMVGIELSEDPATRRQYPPELRMGAQVTQHVRKFGVILRPLGDVVVMMPPLSITPDQIDHLVSATARAISEVCSK